MKEPDQVWAEGLATIKLQMTQATFSTWLANTWVVEAPSGDGVGDEWTIGVPNAYALDWLTHRLKPMVERALTYAAGEPSRVRFVVGSPHHGEDVEKDVRAADEVSSIDEVGPVLEAVREERVTVGEGGALTWTDFYIKLKVAFRKRALKQLKGARLSVFLCLALHVDRDGIAKPGGIEAIMHETGYSRGAVCSALDDLDRAGLIRKVRQHHGADQYEVLGYAWFGKSPAPALWESKK